MFGVSILDDLVQKVIIRLRVSASFSGCCSLLFCPFLCTMLFVLCFYYTFFVCGLFPEGCRILVPLDSYACPLGAQFGPEVCALIPLMGTWFLWPEPALDIERASPSLCGCHGPVCGGSAPWLVEQSPQICFLLWFWSVWRQVGLEHTPWREAPEDCFSGDVPLGMCSVHHFHPLGECHVTLVSTDLGPTSTMGMPAHHSGVSQMLFFPGHQHRSPELRS